jgi:hypothetical protein
MSRSASMVSTTIEVRGERLAGLGIAALLEAAGI